MLIDELEGTLEHLEREGRTPKFIYTVPNFHNPAGVTLSLERRHELVRIASDRELLVLEDNPYGLLRYEGTPLPPLRSLDEQFVIYAGTFSKILSPGVRLGWAAAPAPVLEKMNIGKQGADLCSSSVCQYFVSAYFESGPWLKYVRSLIEIYRRRRDVMLDALAEFLPREARWTHPEKGPIAASEFVAAAEQHNRIAKLTDFVLEKAVAAAAQINKRDADFDIAVNLSARLLTDKGFTLRLSALLARLGLAPQHLTLELTETAALTGSGEGLEMITRLRDLGVNIAIDDYGTGLSTLDYLKKIPANEIKIDQSFVKGMVDNRSDRLMVQSTIGLAHSLDRKVVAEGVEHRDILDLLIGMGCDIAQGFAIGRPMSLESLSKRLASDRKRSAA